MPKDYFQFTNSGYCKMTEQQDKQKVLEFIYQVLRKQCDIEDYVTFLQDGVVIEELLLRSCSTPLGKKNPLPRRPTDQERVEKIVNDMFEFGVSVENLFEPEDLLQAKDISQVLLLLQVLHQKNSLTYVYMFSCRLPRLYWTWP